MALQMNKSCIVLEEMKMSRVEIERRIAEIQAEENEMAERQYRYGYMIDRQYSAKLFQEKMKLMKQLKCR